MTFGLHRIIAPKPTQLRVQSYVVADILATIGLLPRTGGDERHIGINEWVDRVRLSLSERDLYDTTLVIWGLGIEGLFNAVRNPLARDDFELFVQELAEMPALELRDSCLYWLIHSTHLKVFTEAESFDVVNPPDLLASRDLFLMYLNDNIIKDYLQNDFSVLVDLYFNPQALQDLVVRVLKALWDTYFCDEWRRHEADIKQVVQSFEQVDVTGLATFDAIQVITGRDLRAVFHAEVLAEFEQIVCIPSKHNGPYVVWFGDATTLYIIFTARVASPISLVGTQKPDLNVLIQRFKALSDDNRIHVLLAIREQRELSTQDIIEQFDLNKSAASRYLGQLLANGFIVERRDTDGKTKFYSIDDTVIDEFLLAISHLLKRDASQG